MKRRLCTIVVAALTASVASQELQRPVRAPVAPPLAT